MSAIACGCWSPQERFRDLPATSVWENPSRSQQSRATSISPSIAAQALHSFQSELQWRSGSDRIRRGEPYEFSVGSNQGPATTETDIRGWWPFDGFALGLSR